MKNSKIMAIVESIRSDLREIEQIIDNDTTQPQWVFPVALPQDGGPEYFYCASLHSIDGRRNGGYRHTGIDINAEWGGRGDIERGWPVLSIASGEVTSVGNSAGWLGSVVIKHAHNGSHIYARYAHLQDVSVGVGDVVDVGQQIGEIGAYKRGDHLHFDMALDEFAWYKWLSPGISWVDPVDILKGHIEPEEVDALVRDDRIHRLPVFEAASQAEKPSRAAPN